ncbi:hypothetical protein PM082_014650 [Marasmius tenuissimus]|nr:hypothetical protein PM082_014650 [Marasmius tenuissimus]
MAASDFMIDPSAEDELVDQEMRWPKVAPANEVIVKLKDIPGQIPLIICHGGGGTIHSFGPLQKKFHSALWAIQATPETPRNSLHAQAKFYVQKIKQEQSRGPYRLAAFSATAITVLVMAHLFQNDGDKIVQVAFIDHIPTVFFAPPMGLDIDLSSIPRHEARRQFVEKNYSFVCDILKKDGGGKVVRRHKLADGLWDAWQRKPVVQFLQHYRDFMEEFLYASYDFLEEITSRGQVRPPDPHALTEWLQQLDCPLTLFIADKGIRSCIPIQAREEWLDLGVRRGFPRAEVMTLDAGHFDILANEMVLYELQKEFYPSRSSL